MNGFSSFNLQGNAARRAANRNTITIIHRKKINFFLSVCYHFASLFVCWHDIESNTYLMHLLRIEDHQIFLLHRKKPRENICSEWTKTFYILTLYFVWDGHSFDWLFFFFNKMLFPNRTFTWLQDNIRGYIMVRLLPSIHWYRIVYGYIRESTCNLNFCFSCNRLATLWLCDESNNTFTGELVTKILMLSSTQLILSWCKYKFYPRQVNENLKKNIKIFHI